MVLLPPSTVSNIGSVLGEGQSIVREAKLKTNGAEKPVAVKIMDDKDDSRAEVVLSMWVSQQTKRVCWTYGAVQMEFKLMMVMERCKGSLADVLRERDGPLTPAELSRAIIDICAVIAELHTCGVVHCDVKPANCLVRSDGSVALCDFGAAKVRPDSHFPAR